MARSVSDLFDNEIHLHGFVCLFVTSNVWSLNGYFTRILEALTAVIGM